MWLKISFTLLWLSLFVQLFSQNEDSLVQVTGIVYNQDFDPVISAHVINLRTRRMSITDTLGVFRIKVIKGDSLLIKNISFHDSTVSIGNLDMIYTIRLRRKVHPIGELKIFPWGSDYEDMKRAFLAMPSEPGIQKKLGLPEADPDAIPFYLDENQIKSAEFAIKSPVSFIYYNLNKFERSRRKVYRLNKNKRKLDLYRSLVNRERVAELTNLKEEKLETFWIFINENMQCNENCTEYEILREILNLYEKWKPEEK